LDLVWRVSGADAEFIARHGIQPLVVHESSGFNALVAEDIDNTVLDEVVARFLQENQVALQDLAELRGTSELDLAYFIELGEEFSAGVGLSPSSLVALGQAGVALAVTVYLCEEE
jgi:hypothetical protein